MSRFRLTPDGRLRLNENDVRKACLDVLRTHGWWPIRQHVGRLRAPHGDWIQVGEAGDPDYAVIRAPSFFIEFKRPGARPSETQQKRHQILERSYGLETIVVASVEDPVAWLSQKEKKLSAG